MDWVTLNEDVLAFLLVDTYHDSLSLKGSKRGIEIVIKFIVYRLKTDLQLWIVRDRNLADILMKLYFL